MVLLVPDADDVTEDATPVSEQQPKAQLDDSEASKATQKVDLDLDDAPFLEDEDEEEEITRTEEETPMVDDEDDGEPKLAGLLALLKNKFFLIGAGIILVLLVVIVILLLREPEAPPPPPPPTEEQPQAAPAVKETPEILVRLDPFLIEQRDKDGEIRFLEVRILLSTEEEGLAKQFQQETYTIRNALFYYLKNKDLQFLSDKENSDKLKRELLAIVNQYMGFGQFKTLLFDQYLVR
ncbi:MAG: flagellar basal body-associated FliL family protein [Desulfovibrionaceae bacterium]|nr:flagellar basal body-associated FliL family protein [Desulfovibrionaceae bacterium]